MRTDEGDEIIEPGDYEMADGKTLRVWLSEDKEAPEDEQVTMWACTHCRDVDGTMNALLINVIDGNMTTKQDAEGEFLFSMTEAGTDRVKNMIGDLAAGDDL